MLALVLMVGIVIDDAIVVLENIFRFIEEKGMAPFEAAREATAEIALPVLATTMSLVVIFIPVSFMSSVSGRFLYQFGFTAACAILISLLVSFTLDADDERAHVQARQRPFPRRCVVAQRFLRRDRPRLRLHAGGGAAAARPGGGDRDRRDPVGDPAVSGRSPGLPARPASTKRSSR